LRGRVECFFVLKNFRVVLPLGNPPPAAAGVYFKRLKIRYQSRLSVGGRDNS
jgi:hypothetical protein